MEEAERKPAKRKRGEGSSTQKASSGREVPRGAEGGGAQVAPMQNGRHSIYVSLAAKISVHLTFSFSAIDASAAESRRALISMWLLPLAVLKPPPTPHGCPIR
jgi:hypothetical protein